MTVDLIEGHDDWQIFLGAGFLTLFVGMASFLANRGGARGLSVRQAFVLTTLAWVVLAAFAALPFYFAEAASAMSMPCSRRPRGSPPPVPP